MPQKTVIAIYMALELIGLALVMFTMFLYPQLIYHAFIVMGILSVVASYVLFMYSPNFAHFSLDKKYQMVMVSATTWVIMIALMKYFDVFKVLQ